MKRSGMAGWGRAAVVLAALALVLFDLSSPRGLTPSYAGIFSNAKGGASDKDEKSKDKDKDKSTSSSVSSKDNGGSDGGSSDGDKGKPDSSTAQSSTDSGSKDTPSSSGGGGSNASGGHGSEHGKGAAQSGFLGKIMRGRGSDDDRGPVAVRIRSSGPVDPSVVAGAGLFGHVAGRGDVTVWQPGESWGGFFGGGHKPAVGGHSGEGYFSKVAHLKSHSRLHHRARRCPFEVEWSQPSDLPCPPPQVERSLAEAVRDIETAWTGSDLGRLMRHVDREREIRIYYENTFSHALSAAEFEDLTRDALETTRTVSMRLDSVARVSTDVARAKGRHVFYDPDGDERVVYVYYVLERQRCDDGSETWLIREIGQGPEPY